MPTPDSHPLKMIREALGLSQEHFARKLGLSLAMVGQIERGQYKSDPNKLTLRLTQALDLLPTEAAVIAEGTATPKMIRCVIRKIRKAVNA